MDDVGVAVEIVEQSFQLSGKALGNWHLVGQDFSSLADQSEPIANCQLL
jgi:hypothetical protein